MKSISNLLCIVLTAVIIVQSCTKTAGINDDNTAAKNVKKEKVSAKGLGEEDTPPCQECVDYSSLPFKGMSVVNATGIAKDYQTMNKPKLLIGGLKIDATSIWFSVETLKNFIWKIEEATCEQRCPANLNLGIRIYYARYPKIVGTPGTDFASIPPSYKEHHTLFMIPTYQDLTNPSVQWDFDPWHWGGDNCLPTSLSTWMQQRPDPFPGEESLIFSPSEDEYFKTGVDSWGLARNHGSLIPPDVSIGNAFGF